MKLAAVTPVYNEKCLVKGCIKSLEKYVDRHIFLVGEKPYFGNEYEDDGTFEEIEKYGGEAIKGTWSLDHHQRNTGLALLKDYDWIICVDVDMWMTENDMDKLIKELDNSQADAFIIPQTAYWHDTDHVLVNDEFMPVIAVRPHVRFSYIGNIDHPFEISKSMCHHINWCRPKDIFKKVTTYSHAPEMEGEKWYYSNFENWKEGDKVHMPDGKVFDIEYKPLPEELKVHI